MPRDSQRAFATAPGYQKFMFNFRKPLVSRRLGLEGLTGPVSGIPIVSLPGTVTQANQTMMTKTRVDPESERPGWGWGRGSLGLEQGSTIRGSKLMGGLKFFLREGGRTFFVGLKWFQLKKFHTFLQQGFLRLFGGNNFPG